MENWRTPGKHWRKQWKIEENHGTIEENQGNIEEDHEKIEEKHGKMEENHGTIEENQGNIEENHGKIGEARNPRKEGGKEGGRKEKRKEGGYEITKSKEGKKQRQRRTLLRRRYQRIIGKRKNGSRKKQIEKEERRKKESVFFIWLSHFLWYPTFHLQTCCRVACMSIALWSSLLAGTRPFIRYLLGSQESSPDVWSPRMYEHCVMEHLAGTLPLSRYPKSSCDLICAGICWDLKRVLQTCDRLACMSIALWSTLMGLFVWVGIPRVVVI